MISAIIGLVLFIILIVLYVLLVSFIIDRYFYFPKYSPTVLNKPFEIYFENIKEMEDYSKYDELSDIIIALKKDKLSYRIKKYEIIEDITYYKIDFYWVRESKINIKDKNI